MHWPFCLAKCPYCDFNSHVRHQGWDEARFTAAFQRELGHMAALAHDQTVTSIFFGGGTPSLMSPGTVGGILDGIASHWDIAPDLEVTLEANPTSVEASKFAAYRAAGVNRVSLGVQALDDADLKALGRMHTADDALAALAIAKRNFDRVSFDLIYARPKQTPADWRDELARALKHADGHLSLYQLTIEPGTPFAALHAKGALRTPDAARAAAHYAITRELTEAADLPAYEISNHARSGQQCRHNLTYWRGGAYVGVGPGAHGRISIGGARRALACIRSPESWLAQVETAGTGIESNEPLTPAETADEYLMMSLRLAEGADIERFEGLSGRRLDPTLIDALADEGLLMRAAGRIAATARGRMVLDSLIVELAACGTPQPQSTFSHPGGNAQSGDAKPA